MLLALKLQEGVVGQEMQEMQFRGWNNQGNRFSPESFLKEHSHAAPRFWSSETDFRALNSRKKE